MEPSVEVNCPVCGSRDYDILCSTEEIEVHRKYLEWFHRRRLRATASEQALADRADFTQDYATDIVQCRECALLMRNPRPPRRQIEAAYARDEYGQERLQAMFGSQVELARPKARRLVPLLQPGAHVVEVGSFVGGFLAAGQEQGWTMLGVDPGEEVIAFCEQHRLPVFRGTLEATPLEAGQSDAIVIWNTFDQLPDPAPTLAAAQRLLKPGGLLVIRVPNGACFAWSMRCERRLHSRCGRRMRGWLHCAQAWNNLLAFPYLYGYATPNLDRLLSRYCLRRYRIQPDVLVRLSDEQTRTWAVWEERMIKSLLLRTARLQARREDTTYTFAPWLDVIYQSAP